MQVNFCRWRAIDKRFAYLNYIGRRRPNYSLREFIPALDELAENILALPILYLHEINYKRKAENLPPISKSSFFEKVHPKMRFLWALFLLLKEGETPDLEAQVIFEMQALFLVDCAEILCQNFFLRLSLILI
jgi:hypothetical protein